MVSKRKEVAKHMIYQRYLEVVADVSEGEYGNISELLNRHKTLREAREDVKAQVDVGEADMDRYRAENQAIARKTQNMVLLNNNNIHHKQNEIEKLRLSVQAHTDEAEGNNVKRSESKSELAQVVMSIKNLYYRCLSSPYTKSSFAMLKEPAEGGGIEGGEEEAALYRKSLTAFLTECLNVIECRTQDLLWIEKNYRDVFMRNGGAAGKGAGGLDAIALALGTVSLGAGHAGAGAGAGTGAGAGAGGTSPGKGGEGKAGGGDLSVSQFGEHKGGT